MSLSKEEKIGKLNELIGIGGTLILTKSYQVNPISYDPFEDVSPRIEHYTETDDERFPAWRAKALFLLKNLLGDHSTYVKEFETNCGIEASEGYVKQGLGILEAIKSGYEDGTIQESRTESSREPNYPEKYWHCAIKLINQKDFSVINDLSFDELQKKIIEPWIEMKPFNIDGKIVSKRESLEEIKIAQTPEKQEYYEKIHNDKMAKAHILDGATNRKTLPFDEGIDYTQELLFETSIKQDIASDDPSASIVERVCERIGRTANLLKNRRRVGKSPFLVEDEYDVQELLQATLRAFIKHSVQENPLPKIAGNSSRVDISIEELGIVIEVKYVRSPSDQKQLVEDFAQDIMYYSKWEHLKTFLYLIYNSDDLRDPEELEELNGLKENNGRKFNAKVILG